VSLLVKNGNNNKWSINLTSSSRQCKVHKVVIFVIWYSDYQCVAHRRFMKVIKLEIVKLPTTTSLGLHPALSDVDIIFEIPDTVEHCILQVPSNGLLRDYMGIRRQATRKVVNAARRGGRI